MKFFNLVFLILTLFTTMACKDQVVVIQGSAEEECYRKFKSNSEYQKRCIEGTHIAKSKLSNLTCRAKDVDEAESCVWNAYVLCGVVDLKVSDENANMNSSAMKRAKIKKDRRACIVGVHLFLEAAGENYLGDIIGQLNKANDSEFASLGEKNLADKINGRDRSSFYLLKDGANSLLKSVLGNISV